MKTVSITRTWLLTSAITLALVACADDGLSPGVPETLRIEPGSFDLRIGQRADLSLTSVDGSGRSVELPSGWVPAWSSSDTTVVSVRQDGTAVGRKVGTATISVVAGPLSNEVRATVLSPATITHPTAGASATLDRTGGSVTTSADGTRYTLSVPPGALDEPVQIRLTPLRSVQNLPLSGGLVAGVQFSPDGLEFLHPALLTIVTPQPLAPGGLVGFELRGDRFRLTPVRVRRDTLTLLVGHFSEAGVADGDADEIQDLAGIPSAYPEEEAMQDLAAVVAAAGESGTAPNPTQLEGILLDWFVASVEPALKEAATDPDLLEDALAAFARWQSAVSLWADGLMQPQIEAGRAAAADAVLAQVQRLNQQCAAENDWTPVAELLEWVATAELMGLATESSGLQTDQVLAGLCLQIEIMEASLPEKVGALETIELKVRAGLAIGGRQPVFEPSLFVDASGGQSASVSPPFGATEDNGSFTANVSLQEGASQARVNVDVKFPDLPAINASRSLVAQGRVTLDLEGRAAGTNAGFSDEVEIDAGAEAELVVTFRKGRSGNAGEVVVLELEGAGALSAGSVAVGSEGTQSVWYAAPAQGEGETIVVAKFVADGELLTAPVTIRYSSDEPVDLELDFGNGEPDPSIEGPVLRAGVAYVIRVSGTYSIWTSEWENGPCKGSPGSGAGGQTGLDAENFFAIPIGSVLCGSSFECCPNHTSKFRMSLDGGGGFSHIHPEGGEQYNPSHIYQYRVIGQGQPIHFMIQESNARGDDYGVLSIRIARE